MPTGLQTDGWVCGRAHGSIEDPRVLATSRRVHMSARPCAPSYMGRVIMRMCQCQQGSKRRPSSALARMYTPLFTDTSVSKGLRKQKPCLSMTPPLLLGVCLALALVSSTLAQSINPTATATVSPTVSPSPTVTTDTDADGVVDALDRCPSTAVSAAPWNRCVDGVGRGGVCVRVHGAIRWVPCSGI